MAKRILLESLVVRVFSISFLIDVLNRPHQFFVCFKAERFYMLQSGKRESRSHRALGWL